MDTAKKVGGARAGAGRKKGVPNKKTAQVQALFEAGGETPLQFMLDIMRSKLPPEGSTPGQVIAFHTLRFEAAKAAAPYVHPKLASVEHKGPGGGPVQVTHITRRIVQPS